MTIIEEAREYALSEIKRYGTPPIVLFEIGEEKALQVARMLKADEFIVHLGIILLDLKLGQAIKENRWGEHVKMSVDSSKEFLKRFNLDKEVEEKIINCVEAHHKDVEFKCLEAEICANADCCRFLHPKGFFAYLMLLGKRSENFDENLNQAEKKLDEKMNILSLEIFKEELSPYYKLLKNLIADCRNLN